MIDQHVGAVYGGLSCTCASTSPNPTFGRQPHSCKTFGIDLRGREPRNSHVPEAKVAPLWDGRTKVFAQNSVLISVVSGYSLTCTDTKHIHRFCDKPALSSHYRIVTYTSGASLPCLFFHISISTMSGSEHLSDDYVAQLLAKDAKTSNTKYSLYGLQELLPPR